MKTDDEDAGVAARRAGAQGKTILLAEDTRTLRMLYAHYLRDAGYAVVQAGDGVDAQPVMLGGATVHLLLTDYHMPTVDGMELAHWFHVRFSEIPVLFLSATIDHLDVAHAAMPYATCGMKPTLAVEFIFLVEQAIARGVQLLP